MIATGIAATAVTVNTSQYKSFTVFIPESVDPMADEAPDPSNSPPEEWLGDVVDDSFQIDRLLTLTVADAALGADLDRVEGIS